MPFYVYTLADPRTDEIRYVGQTFSPELRLRQHIHSEVGSNESKRLWVEEVLKAGFEPRMDIVEIIEEKEKINEREKYWIQYHLEKGLSLLNVRSTRKSSGQKPVKQKSTKKEASKQSVAAQNGMFFEFESDCPPDLPPEFQGIDHSQFEEYQVWGPALYYGVLRKLAREKKEREKNESGHPIVLPYDKESGHPIIVLPQGFEIDF